jgi:hypothetical protein
MPFGSWPVLVKRGCLEVSHPFPLHERAKKTALLLRGSFSISLVEVPVLSTSPKLAKSPSWLIVSFGAPCQPMARRLPAPRGMLGALGGDRHDALLSQEPLRVSEGHAAEILAASAPAPGYDAGA